MNTYLNKNWRPETTILQSRNRKAFSQKTESQRGDSIAPNSPSAKARAAEAKIRSWLSGWRWVWEACEMGVCDRAAHGSQHMESAIPAMPGSRRRQSHTSWWLRIMGARGHLRFTTLILNAKLQQCRPSAEHLAPTSNYGRRKSRNIPKLEKTTLAFEASGN